MVGLKTANLMLSFLLELAALVALGYWGFHTGDTLIMQLILGLGAPLLMAIVWGALLAPASERRLPDPGGFILALVIFAIAATALAVVGQAVFAIIFAVLVVLNMVLSRVWK